MRQARQCEILCEFDFLSSCWLLLLEVSEDVLHRNKELHLAQLQAILHQSTHQKWLNLYDNFCSIGFCLTNG